MLKHFTRFVLPILLVLMLLPLAATHHGPSFVAARGDATPVAQDEIAPADDGAIRAASTDNVIQVRAATTTLHYTYQGESVKGACFELWRTTLSGSTLVASERCDSSDGSNDGSITFTTDGWATLATKQTKVPAGYTWSRDKQFSPRTSSLDIPAVPGGLTIITRDERSRAVEACFHVYKDLGNGKRGDRLTKSPICDRSDGKVDGQSSSPDVDPSGGVLHQIDLANGDDNVHAADIPFDAVLGAATVIRVLNYSSPSAVPNGSPTPTPSATATPSGGSTGSVGLSLSSTEASPGQTLRVSIRNFPADTDVAIYVDASRKITMTTDADGKARGSFKLPSLAAGSHPILAKGGGKSTSAPFKIVPDAKVSVTSVAPGGSLTVTMRGFTANSLVTVRLYRSGSSGTFDKLGSVTTDDKGTATIKVVVPKTSTSGSKTLVIIDASKLRDTATVTIS